MRISLVITALLLALPCVLGASTYLPYVHQVNLPNHPTMRLFGQYQTLLYAGAATYTYAIDVPPGTNGLSPQLSLSYNSQASGPSMAGLGWSLPQNKIVRDLNGTPDNQNDDRYLLFLNGWQYELVYDNALQAWRTEVDYHFRIRNLMNGTTPYWDVTTTDGTVYRFGATANATGLGRGYATAWYHDLTTDVWGNTITYEYNVTNGILYPTLIHYNRDDQRRVTFWYEAQASPTTYDDGVPKTISQRLTDISVTANGALVHRYHVAYQAGGYPSLLMNITQYGADNTTTLPPVTFTYGTSSSGYASSALLSPVNFTNASKADAGVRVVDVNNDGLPDIIQAGGGTRAVWLNTGAGWQLSNWSVPLDVVTASGGDAGVRFADVNNDGLIDILQANGTNRAVYLGNGTGWALSAWSLPVEFVNSSGTDQGVQLLDVNGDGRIDIIQARTGLSDQVYVNNGGGWTQTTGWSIPVRFADSTDLGARIADVNGDGLPDILLGNGTRDAWLNNGTGWLENTSWAPPTDFKNATFQDTGLRIVDLNGDGLPDLTQNLVNGSTSVNHTWLNNGTGWVQNDSFTMPAPLAFNLTSMDRRIVDVDGDGQQDLMIASVAQLQTFTRNPNTAFLLVGVRNEYGGTTNISYAPSTRYNNTALGFPIMTVANITRDNGMTGPARIQTVTTYAYASGSYNNTKREFRGFGTTTEQTPTKTIVHNYYQDAARRAKEYATSILSTTGVLYQTTTTDYNYTYAGGIYNLTILARASFAYDGTTVPRVTNTSYVYDWFGNLWSAKEYGDVNVTGDERTTNNTFGYNKDAWILNRIATSRTYDTTGAIVRQAWFYYDGRGLTGVGANGALTRKEDWNSNGNNTVTTLEYDPFGNVLRSTDSVGAQTMFQYDATHTFTTTTVNALGQTAYASYDQGTGNVLWMKKNDLMTSYSYDVSGRIAKEIQPYDTTDAPTKQYRYLLNGSAPTTVGIALRTTANNTMDTAYYYDGNTNLIQAASATDTGLIVKNLYYDGDARVIAEDNPYTTTGGNYSVPAGGVPQTNYTYDPLDRVVLVLNPDGSNKTTTFNRSTVTDVDENGHQHQYDIDAYSRIIRVHEFNNDPRTGSYEYVTRYAYDANDNLVGITDAVGNTFTFTYDSLSRKTGMSDPDMGLWSYQYDTRNNLVRQIDARNTTIDLAYDLLNRVVRKNTTDTLLTFSYDAQYAGTLSNVTQNGTSIAYTYDERYRPTTETVTTNGASFSTNYVYDSQDRLLSEQGLSKVDYYYDRQGTLTKIPGYVNWAAHDAFGAVASRTYANGLVATYTYDGKNHRLLNITIPNVLQLNYSYDAVGNIKRINDILAGRQTSLAYDGLDRLITATIGSDRYSYAYSPTGNMMNIVKNNASKKFIYNGLAHAPSSILDNAAGADIQQINDLNTSSKNRTIEFFVANDLNTTTNGVNLTVTFGDGNTITKTNWSINNSVLCFVQNNYSRGGDYVMNISAASWNDTDYEAKRTKFGVRAQALSALGANVSIATYEWIVTKDVTETLPNVSWNCTGIVGPKVNLTGAWENYLSVNYSSPGLYTFGCVANGTDGNESRTVTIDIPGVSVQNVDTLYTNASRRVFAAVAKNAYYPLTANVTITGENLTNATRLVTLGTNEQLFVFVEANNTPGDAKGINTLITGGNDSANITTIYDVKTTSLAAYARIDLSNTSKLYTFEVRNLWTNGTLAWTLSDPNLANQSVLGNNQSVMLLIASNYTSGDKTPTLRVANAGYNISSGDQFRSRPIAITRLTTLADGSAGIAEFFVQNSLPTPQNVTWQYTGAAANFTNTTTVNNSLLVLIQTNYSAGVCPTTASVNASLGNDSKRGVVIA